MAPEIWGHMLGKQGPPGTFKEVHCSERTEGGQGEGEEKSKVGRLETFQRLEKLGCKGKNQIEEELFVEGHTSESQGQVAITGTEEPNLALC